MGRPAGSKNKAKFTRLPEEEFAKLSDNGRSEKLAPKDCPERGGSKRCRMYVWYCKQICVKFGECAVWGNVKKVEITKEG